MQPLLCEVKEASVLLTFTSSSLSFCKAAKESEEEVEKLRCSCKTVKQVLGLKSKIVLFLWFAAYLQKKEVACL
jgi:hypothetical protein